MAHKTVFLDEYSLGGHDLTPIRRLVDYKGFDRTSPEEVLRNCADAEIVITNKVVLSAETMRQLPDLRFIAIAATGMNNVDLEAARKLGIGVRNAAGYSTYAVAEATLSAALSLVRETVYYDRYFKSREYAESGTIFRYDRPIRQLRGKNWGIIGLGNIGREVARLAEAFGCEVAYCSTSGKERPEKYERMTLGELLGWADIVSIHSPLTDATRNLIGSEQFSQMKRNAIIINVARGGIIDESALAEALNDGTIAGAALDVFSQEPLCESPLYDLKDPYRLLASPHNAWATDEAIARLIDCIARNIEDYIAGERH